MEKVYCDPCGKDFSDLPDQGGFIVGLTAYGPCCAEAMLGNLTLHHEEHLIKAKCPQGMSFKDWIINQVRYGGRRLSQEEILASLPKHE